MSLTGITNLSTLLREMRPALNAGAYVFCTVPEEQIAELVSRPVCTFRETKGVTLIVTQNEADRDSLSYDGLWAWVTLRVHASLSAVGFLAAITAGLADAGLPANAFSGYLHDHLFVPFDKRDLAMNVLRGLQMQQGPHSE